MYTLISTCTDRFLTQPFLAQVKAAVRRLSVSDKIARNHILKLQQRIAAAAKRGAERTSPSCGSEAEIMDLQEMSSIDERSVEGGKEDGGDGGAMGMGRVVSPRKQMQRKETSVEQRALREKMDGLGEKRDPPL